MLSFFKKLFTNSNAVELTTALHSGALLVDVRTPAEFAAGSAKGAINIPLFQLSNHLPKLHRHTSIVVFCASGVRSTQAKHLLSKAGIQTVYNGGTWQKINSLLK
ncbi:MAG: rhodanese-like domain-containing protein [Bacteroidetes bacterium]|nr:MAG: rhodanese-like domain-containing protein [Bacteroidota bacterium]TAE71603.1 MAG: rhodanese-like domain-containing protein [Bacteroidota bacterium]TAF93265.1 MAG: rhodanese-like domain-containing protein [Bacteroidota bacterium]